MIQVQDYTAHVSENKTARKELKMKPSIIDAISRAANITGMDVSTFISSAAYQKAQAVEETQFTTTLTTVNFDAFAEAVDGKGKKIDALTAIMTRSQEMLVDG